MKIDMMEFHRTKAAGRESKTEAMIDLVKHVAGRKEKVTMILPVEQIAAVKAQFTEEELRFVSFHTPTVVEVA